MSEQWVIWVCSKCNDYATDGIATGMLHSMPCPNSQCDGFLTEQDAVKVRAVTELEAVEREFAEWKEAKNLESLPPTQTGE